MKIKFIYFVALALLAASCNGSKVKISGRMVGSDATKIYLEQVTPIATQLIDSATLDQQGDYQFTIDGAGTNPALYNVVYDSQSIPVLVEAGQSVKVSAVGSPLRNYTVEGSDESELLRSFYQPYVKGAQALEKLGLKYGDMELSEPERKALAKQYTDEYYRIRREQLRFIIENKSHIAAVFALYQRLPGDSHLFNGDSDVIYYREVMNAITEKYPTSPYINALQGLVNTFDARIKLSSEIQQIDYPDIELSDMYGRKVKLSSLAGRVILLDFWSAELGNSNALNAELKQLYEKYSKANTPLEVYQVAIDTNKALWINAVQDQELPWISVSDLSGGNSIAARTYKVEKLPTNFLIDKNSQLVARDIYGSNLEDKLDELTK